MMKAKLECPECRKRLDGTSVLGCAEAYWPHEWCSFNCPACKAHVLFKVLNEGIVIGEVDGFPGPTFMPLSRQRVKGLVAELANDVLTVRLGNREWKIPYRYGEANQPSQPIAGKPGSG